MSLGLVAYGDSDESENEIDSGEDAQNINSCINSEHVQSKTSVDTNIPSPLPNGYTSDDETGPVKSIENGTTQIIDGESDPVENNVKTVNLHRPESKLSLINTDIDIKRLTSSNKKSGTVKITIPSLNEVIDESEPPSKKKLKPSQKGSGLFALLPSPKSSLVPQSVINKKPIAQTVKKPNPVTSTSTKPVPAPKVSNVNKSSSLISYEDSGDEDETSETVDFFSLESKDKDVIPPLVDLTTDFVEVAQPVSQTGASPDNTVSSSSTPNWAANTSWQNTTRSSNWEGSSNTQPSSSSVTSQPADHYTTSEFMSFNNSALELDQQAMQQLCGRRDRLKMQDVSLIDVSGDAIMPDSREWLTKQLTEETAHRPSHKRKDGPTTQQKRKHQITYLAYQAKENELELKNQWANNRMSRKQTQAKYGF